jgi:Fe-S oxidoreductase
MESYNLDIPVMHHSEYLLDLVRSEQISLYRKDVTYTYHDPCELGRGSGVYQAPRELLEMTGSPKVSVNEKDKSMCCGGSLANLFLSGEERGEIAKRTVSNLSVQNPDFIASACPLCKKTLNQYSTIEVKDIAELVAESMYPVLNDPEVKRLKEKCIPVS